MVEITYDTYISFTQAKRLVHELLRMECINTSGHKYRITEKGRKLHYLLERLFEIFPDAREFAMEDVRQ